MAEREPWEDELVEGLVEAGNKNFSAADSEEAMGNIAEPIAKAIKQGGSSGQQQSDWNETDTSKVTFIKNKPSFPSDIPSRQEMAAAIGAETTRAMAAEASLQTQINGKASQEALAAETAARESADTQLQSNIEAETARAEAAESALGERIDGVEGDVEAIDTRLTTAEGGIDNLESSVDALYNTEVEQTDGETSVSSSTSGKVKTFVVGLASAIKTKIEAAYSHISDAVKHVTATERTNWNTAYSHSQTEGNPHGTEIEEIDGLRTELTTIESDVSAIEGVIPSEATTTNQLADKAFVNSSITTNTATFRGTSAKNLTEAQFLAWANSLTKTKNDYCFWDTTDSDGNVVFKRYKWNDVQWEYEYTLNNSSFTAAQWAAIQSGITAEDVADIGYNTTARHTHANKNLLDTYTQSNASLADAVAKKHEHANKDVLDDTTASYTSEEKTKLEGIESGAEVNVNADWNATSGDAQILNKPSTFPPSSHTHEISNVNGLQSALNGKAATTHTHSVKINGSTKTIPASGGTPVDLGTYLTSHQDISGKADKVSNATANHFAGLNASGNLIDSGKKASDFATAAQGEKADTAYQKPSGGIPKTDLATSVQTSLGKADTALQSADLSGYLSTKNLYSSSSIYGVKFATTTVTSASATSYATYLFSRLQIGTSIGSLSGNGGRPLSGFVQIFQRTNSSAVTTTATARITVFQPDYTGNIRVYYKINGQNVDWYIATTNTQSYCAWRVTKINEYGTVNSLDLVALTSLVGLTEINASYKTPLVDASSTGVGLSTKPVYVDESGKVIECSREIPDMQGYHKDYSYCKRIVLNVPANNGVIIRFDAPSSGQRFVQFFIRYGKASAVVELNVGMIVSTTAVTSCVASILANGGLASTNYPTNVRYDFNNGVANLFFSDSNASNPKVVEIIAMSNADVDYITIPYEGPIDWAKVSLRAFPRIDLDTLLSDGGIGSPTQPVYVDATGAVQACTGNNIAAASNQNITPTKAQLEANQYFIYRNNNATTYNLNIDADLLVDGKVYSITLVGDSSVTPNRTWNVRFKSSGGVANTYSDYANYSVSTGTLTTSFQNVEISTTWRNKQVVRKGRSVYIFGY